MQINRIRGDTYADSFTINNDTEGEIANISGYTFLMTLSTMRNPIDNTTEVYQLSGDITDAVNGVVEFAPDANQADQVGLFYYDIQMVDTSGVKRTLVKDVYVYEEDITKN